MARPTKYTDKLALDICSRIAEGESVRSIAKDSKMPNASTIHAWVLDNVVFSKQYEVAKSIGAEVESESMIELAHTMEDTTRAKLVIDTIKWSLSKKLPKRFGDKSTLVTEDEEGKQQPLMVQIIGKNDKSSNGDTL